MLTLKEATAAHGTSGKPKGSTDLQELTEKTATKETVGESDQPATPTVEPEVPQSETKKKTVRFAEEPSQTDRFDDANHDHRG